MMPPPIHGHTEVLLNISLPGRRLAMLALAVACLALPAVAHADFRDNMLCKGHIAAGPKDETGLLDNPVAYRFACSQPITGYSIISDKEVDAWDTEVFVKDGQNNVIPTDSFSCNGESPGFGVNCIGKYNTPWSIVEAAYNMSTAKLCAEPRHDPLLVVTYATYGKDASGAPAKDSAGNPVVTTTLAGPFDLGRPRGCKRTKFSGKTRIPAATGDSPAEATPAARRHR
jgi:hypothetical protein